MKTIYRKTYIDILRILANFLVIFNHTAGFALYQNTYGTARTGFYMFFSIITKINVPLFFMITGALLLGKDEEINYVLKKRVLRFFLLIVCASTFMYLLKMSDSVTPYKLVNNVFTCFIEGSYWYLYAHLAFLFMLPYLRRIVRSFTQKDFIYIIGIHFIFFTLLPILDYSVFTATGSHFTLYNEINLPLMTVKAFFYPIIGFYLDKHVDISKLTFRKLFPLFVISFLGICITEVFTFHQGFQIGYTEDFFELFDYVLAITAFLFVKYLVITKDCLKKLPLVTKTITFVAPFTLGIYLLDPCWKYLIEPQIFNFLLSYVPLILNSAIYCLISMVLGGCVTYILKKLPFFKAVL